MREPETGSLRNVIPRARRTMLDDLRTILARYPAIAQPCATPEALGMAGGESGARMWRFPSGRGMLVARMWPVDGPGRDSLERMHRWLRETAGLGFVPIPLAGLDGRTLHECGGRFWEVTPWLEGAPASQLPFSNARLKGGYAALAAFHQRLAHESVRAPSPALRARISETEAWQSHEFDKLKRTLANAPDEPCRELARQWLALAESVASEILGPVRRAAERMLVLQPCLRDARPEHVLFTDDTVSGLIDFGAMGIECVAGDLARLLAEWPGPNPILRAEALDAYSAIRPLAMDDLAVIDAFESSAALLGAGHWARWRFHEQRDFVDPEAVERGLERGLVRLSRLAMRS